MKLAETLTGLIYQKNGKPAGNYRTWGRRPTKAEQDWIAQFIDRTKSKDEEMVDFSKRLKGQKEMAQKPATQKKQDHPQPEEKCNMVFLAGAVASKIGTYEGENARFLIDAGPDQKFIGCTVYKSTDLVDKLTRYEKGDFIRLHGFVRVWSKKDEDGNWLNTTEIRVTHIKNDPPKRERPQASNVPAGFITDDDIPF